jgi:hypothetical protein
LPAWTLRSVPAGYAPDPNVLHRARSYVEGSGVGAGRPRPGDRDAGAQWSTRTWRRWARSRTGRPRQALLRIR